MVLTAALAGPLPAVRADRVALLNELGAVGLLLGIVGDVHLVPQDQSVALGLEPDEDLLVVTHESVRLRPDVVQDAVGGRGALDLLALAALVELVLGTAADRDVVLVKDVRLLLQANGTLSAEEQERVDAVLVGEDGRGHCGFD